MDLRLGIFAGIAVLYTVLLVVLLNVMSYLFGRYRGRRAVVRQSTSSAQDSLILHEGDTLVGVVELKKGTYFFLTLNTRTRIPYDESLLVALTKGRSTPTDGSPVPTPDGRSKDGTILPEFGA